MEESVRAGGLAHLRLALVAFFLALAVAVPLVVREGVPRTAGAPPWGPSAAGRSGTLNYSGYLGGIGEDLDWAMTVDAAGAVYVAGSVNYNTFPATPGAFQTTFGGMEDGFVAKISPDGTRIVWATYLGGVLGDSAFAIAVDPSGVYVGGNSAGGRTLFDGFPVTPGAYDTGFNGYTDGFVAKLSTDGSRLLWATYIGGYENDAVSHLAVDAAGNVYVAGSTDSPNFPTTPGAFDRTCGTNGTCNFNGYQGFPDGFVAELSADGSSLVWSTFLGGENWEGVGSLAIDDAGDLILAGTTNSVAFPVTPGTFQQALRGSWDGYVAKMDPTGSSLVWSTYFGGNGWGGAIAVVDPIGGILVGGGGDARDMPVTPGAFQTSYGGGIDDAFLARMSSDGTTLLWGTYFGGSEMDRVGFRVDATGTIYLYGQTNSTDMPTTCDAFQRTYVGGGSDAFFGVMDATGSRLLYGTFLGGSGYDDGATLALDPAGNAYTTGRTGSADFPVTPGAFDTTFHGDVDVFVAKLRAPVPSTPPTLSWTGETNYRADGLDPETGTTRTTFSYRVLYADADGDPAVTVNVRIEKPLGTPWGTFPASLAGWRGAPDNYAEGAIYAFNTTLPAGTDYWYSFQAADWCNAATGPPTVPIDAPDVIADDPPTAVALASPTVVHMGEAVTFDGSQSHDDFGIAAYRWDFGDGASNATAVTSHAYGARGAFTAILTVWDTGNQTGTDNVTIDVVNRPPVADAGPDRTVQKRTAVTLDGTHSSDPDGDVLAFAWTQVGGPATSLSGAATPNPTFTPTRAGAYAFRLAVDDAHGGAAQDTVAITAWGLPPTARLVANRSAATAGSPIAFDGTASSDPDGQIVDFAFAFGDGATTNGTEATRAHAFAASGTYTVTLTVTDDDGNTSTAQVSVEITTAAPPPSPGTANYKPLVAAVFAIVLALVGAWSSRRAPWPGGTRRRLRAFLLTALPFVAAEAATGVVSFFTGLLAIPSPVPVGIAVDSGILVAGCAALTYRALKRTPSTGEIEA